MREWTRRGHQDPAPRSAPGPEANAAGHVYRPDDVTTMAPGAELDHLHSFVADTAIPTPVTGSAPVTPALARQVRLDDTGKTLQERVEYDSRRFSAKVRVPDFRPQDWLDSFSGNTPVF
jgi:hypothetical protein